MKKEQKKTTQALNEIKIGQDGQKKEQEETNKILTELLQVIKCNIRDVVGIKGKNYNWDGNDGPNNVKANLANLLDNDKNNI